MAAKSTTRQILYQKKSTEPLKTSKKDAKVLDEPKELPAKPTQVHRLKGEKLISELTTFINEVAPEPNGHIAGENGANLDDTEKLYNWIDTHPLINLSGLCKTIGYDVSNFFNWKKKRGKLQPYVLLKIEKELSKYGYQK